MDFCAEWLNNLLCSLDKNCDSGLFDSCAKLHYQMNGMDDILEQMFSKVCRKKVEAKVKRSILRDGKSCIYELSNLTSIVDICE